MKTTITMLIVAIIAAGGCNAAGRQTSTAIDLRAGVDYTPAAGPTARAEISTIILR